jgi:hypothetical protein
LFVPARRREGVLRLRGVAGPVTTL